jgi:hypothetical protein
MARKNTMMPMSTGRGPSRFVAGLVAVVLLALAIHDPVGAAHTARSVFGWLGSMLDSLGAFGSAVSR